MGRCDDKTSRCEGGQAQTWAGSEHQTSCRLDNRWQEIITTCQKTTYTRGQKACAAAAASRVRSTRAKALDLRRYRDRKAFLMG